MLGEDYPPHHPPQRDATGAAIGCVDVVGSLRIVEFRHGSLDDDVVTLLWPIIDARLADLGTAVRNRRNIAQIQQRKPFGALLGYRAHDRTVAVGEQNMEID